jgi:hypothetical protein
LQVVLDDIQRRLLASDAAATCAAESQAAFSAQNAQENERTRDTHTSKDEDGDASAELMAWKEARGIAKEEVYYIYNRALIS